MTGQEKWKGLLLVGWSDHELLKSAASADFAIRAFFSNN
jgi:hypothetical protein